MMGCLGFFLSQATMKDCSNDVHTGHIESLTMDPPAPISGDWVTVHIAYTLEKPITGGQAIYTASLNGFPLTPTTNELCTDMETTTTPCPIQAGQVSFEGISQLGDGTIHGTISATTTWIDQDGEEVLCWGLSVRF